ncbi:unnamed protein product, partial [Didymodactylos carnosus]
IQPIYYQQTPTLVSATQSLVLPNQTTTLTQAGQTQQATGPTPYYELTYATPLTSSLTSDANGTYCSYTSPLQGQTLPSGYTYAQIPTVQTGNLTEIQQQQQRDNEKIIPFLSRHNFTQIQNVPDSLSQRLFIQSNGHVNVR